MFVSDHRAACRLYPLVPPAAVDHMLHSIERIGPLLEALNPDEAGQLFATCLDHYPGDPAELAALGAYDTLMACAGGDPWAVVLQLARAGLAGRGMLPHEGTRFLLIGNALDAQVWAMGRLIPRDRVVSVPAGVEPHRLYGLAPALWAIVVLPGAQLGDALAERLQVMIAGGATVLPSCWGAPDQPGLAVRT